MNLSVTVLPRDDNEVAEMAMMADSEDRSDWKRYIAKGYLPIDKILGRDRPLKLPMVSACFGSSFFLLVALRSGGTPSLFAAITFCGGSSKDRSQRPCTTDATLESIVHLHVSTQGIGRTSHGSTGESQVRLARPEN